jgi:hypothetical protein
MKAPDYEHIKELEVAIDRIINRNNRMIMARKMESSCEAAASLSLTAGILETHVGRYCAIPEIHNNDAAVTESKSDSNRSVSYGFDYVTGCHGFSSYDICFQLTNDMDDIIRSVLAPNEYDYSYWKSHRMGFTSLPSSSNDNGMTWKNCNEFKFKSLHRKPS